MFLGKGVLKICRKFTREHPCRSVISINLQINFIKNTLRHGCSPVNLLHIFRTLFLKNTSGWLLLVIKSTFVHHFVDPDLTLEKFFEKDRTAENRGADFEIDGKATPANVYWSLKKISCKACLLFYCYFGDKKYILKALLTCTFILPLLSSESRKRYKLKLCLCI